LPGWQAKERNAFVTSAATIVTLSTSDAPEPDRLCFGAHRRSVLQPSCTVRSMRRLRTGPMNRVFASEAGPLLARRGRGRLEATARTVPERSRRLEGAARCREARAARALGRSVPPAVHPATSRPRRVPVSGGPRVRRRLTEVLHARLPESLTCIVQTNQRCEDPMHRVKAGAAPLAWNIESGDEPRTLDCGCERMISDAGGRNESCVT